MKQKITEEDKKHLFYMETDGRKFQLCEVNLKSSMHLMNTYPTITEKDIEECKCKRCLMIVERKQSLKEKYYLNHKDFCDNLFKGNKAFEEWKKSR